MRSNQHSITVLLLSLIISTAIIAYGFSRRTDKGIKRFSMMVFSGSNGWGYDILVDDSVYIHQESIPALGKGKGFPEKGQAEKAAKLVLKKLQGKGGLPTLSRFEVEEICASVK